MEQKTPKVSIVVPMYRCEDTLERCVDSVLAQTCPDFELLLINDGSPDRVPEIAAGYVQRDPRVRLLSQENRGVSAARNAGIDAAKGRYLLFVDADDRLCKDAVETLLLAAKGGAQVIHFAYIRQKGALSQVVPSPVNAEGVLAREEIRQTVLPLLLSGWSLNACWNNFYETRLLQENGIRFPEGMALDEDFAFVCDVFAAASSAQFLQKPLYRYLLNPKSAVRRMDERHVRASMDIQFGLFDKLYDWDVDTPQNRQLVWEKLVRAALILLDGVAVNDRNPNRKALFWAVALDGRVQDALEHAGRLPGTGITRKQAKLLQKGRIGAAYALVRGVIRAKGTRDRIIQRIGKKSGYRL